MSDHYPPPRRLTRSTTDRFVGGVCGGLAQYLNIDATIVRLITVVITLSTGGFPLALYVIALLVIPEDDRTRPPSGGTRPPVYPPSAAPGPRPAPPAGPGDPVWGREGAPWEQPQDGPQTRPVPEPPADRT